MQKQLRDMNIQVIDENNIKENNGIYIVTSKLAKGLEFNGVIITNVNEDNYHSNDDLDMKLLYVSMTRAMHKLIILYNDSLPKSLKI